MMVDRKKIPALEELQAFPFTEPESITFENGCTFSQFKFDSKDYLYFHLIFFAGRIHSRHKLVAELSIEGILSGNESKSAAKISSELEFYGCFIESEAMDEYAVIKVHVLRKYADQVLTNLNDCIRRVSYPDDEFKNICLRKKSQLQVLLQRGDILTNRALRNHMFGDEHPFGRLALPEDYSLNLKPHCQEFWKEKLSAGPQHIILGGPGEDDLTKLIETLWGKGPRLLNHNPLTFDIHSSQENRVHINLNSTVQSSIKLGMFLPAFSHSDFDMIRMSNLLLSGSFGSRLMQALREDKGYTYGVYASHYIRQGMSWLDISLETDIQYVEPAIHEINEVLQRLHSEPADAEELFILRNNYVGNMMRKGDGIIGLVSMYTTSIVQNLPLNDFVRFSSFSKTVDGNQIAEISKKYFNLENCKIITCH